MRVHKEYSSTKTVNRVFNRVELFISGAAATCFASALILNFLNVLGRYLFHTPIYWAEEVTTILIIWSVCLMSLRLSMRGEHLVTDVIRPYLSVFFQRLLVLATCFIGLALTIYLAYYAFVLVKMVHDMGQVTLVAEIPKSMTYAAILTFLVLAVLGILFRMRKIMLGDSRALSPHDNLDIENEEGAIV